LGWLCHGIKWFYMVFESIVHNFNLKLLRGND
jgi:hypothetical protein